jgi:hypothetical protein
MFGPMTFKREWVYPSGGADVRDLRQSRKNENATVSRKVIAAMAKVGELSPAITAAMKLTTTASSATAMTSL